MVYLRELDLELLPAKKLRTGLTPFEPIATKRYCVFYNLIKRLRFLNRPQFDRDNLFENGAICIADCIILTPPNRSRSSLLLLNGIDFIQPCLHRLRNLTLCNQSVYFFFMFFLFTFFYLFFNIFITHFFSLFNLFYLIVNKLLYKFRRNET